MFHLLILGSLLLLTKEAVIPEHCYDLTQTTDTEVFDFCGSGVPANRYGNYKLKLAGQNGTPFCGPAGCGFDDPGMFATDWFPYFGSEFTIGIWYIRYQTDDQDASIVNFVNKNNNDMKLSLDYRKASYSYGMRGICDGVEVNPSENQFGTMQWAFGYIYSTTISWEAGFYKAENFNDFSYVTTTTGPCIFDQTDLILVFGALRASATAGQYNTEVRGLLRHIQIWTTTALTRTSSPGLMDVITDYKCPHLIAFGNDWCMTPLVFFQFSSTYVVGQTVTDRSLANHHGTLGSDTTVESNDPTLTADGLYFDGNDELTVKTFCSEHQMGYEAWIKIGDYSRNNMEMLKILMDGSSDLYLYMDASNRKTRLKYGSRTEQSSELYSSGSRSNNCCWDHYAISWAARRVERSYVYQYWNGERKALDTVSTGMDRIMGGTIGGNFVGTIKRIKVFPIPRGTQLISYYYKDHPSCTQTQYYDGSSCQDCDGSCSTRCWGPLSTDCYSGTVTYTDMDSLICCPKGTYWNSTVNSCENCHSRCTECETSSTNCLSCATGLTQTNNRCCNDTALQFYQAWSNTCETCHANCDGCTASGNFNCVTCAADKKYYSGNTTACYDSCPTTNYYDNNNVCTACDNTCLTCNGGNSDDCLSCQNSRLYKSSTNQCVTSCASNQYYNVTNQDCESCDGVCDGCTGPTNYDCIACANGKVMISSGYCGDSCNANQYNNNGICTACHVDCVDCTGPTDSDCSNCIQGLYMNPNSICQTDCPIKYYKNETANTCDQCHALCAECTGGNDQFSCTTCINEVFKKEDTGECVTACPADYYFESATLCKRCHASCKQCSGQLISQCTACPDNTYLTSTGICAGSCPTNNFYPNSGNWTCLACHANCEKCNGPLVSDCVTCNPSVLEVFGSNLDCVTQCPNYYYDDGAGYCKDCSSLCKTCSGPGVTQCITCRSGNVLLQDGSCFNLCGNNQYINPSNQCADCANNCNGCSGPTESDCDACAAGYIMNGSGVCEECSTNQYFDQASMTCANCHILCDGCTGPSITQCNNCATGAKLIVSTGVCAQTCPSGLIDYGDSCRDKLPDIQVSINENNELIITLSEQVSFDDQFIGKMSAHLAFLKNNVLNIQVTGTQSNYDYSTEITTLLQQQVAGQILTDKLKVTIDINSAIYPGQDVTIQYNVESSYFNSVNNETSDYNGGFVVDQPQSSGNSSIDYAHFQDSSEKLASGLALLMLSLLFLSSICCVPGILCWRFIYTLQMLAVFPLVCLPLPWIMTIYLNVLSIFNLRARQIAKTTNSINGFFKQSYSDNSLNTCFSSGWYPGLQFLANEDFKLYFMMAYAIMILPLSLVGRGAQAWCKSKAIKACCIVFHSARFFTRLMLFFFLDLVIATTLHIKSQFNLKWKNQRASLAFFIISILLIITYLLASLLSALLHKPFLVTEKKWNKSVFIQEIKQSQNSRQFVTRLRLLFYFFFLLQRVIFGILVVALNNKSQEREKKLGLSISLVILFFAGLLYSILLCPFARIFWIIYTIIEQAIFLILAILLLYFQQTGYSLNESEMEKVGIFIIVLISLLIIFGLVFAILEMILDVRKQQKEFRKKRLFTDPTSIENSLQSIEDIIDDKEKLKQFDEKRYQNSNLRPIRSTNFYTGGFKSAR